MRLVAPGVAPRRKWQATRAPGGWSSFDGRFVLPGPGSSDTESLQFVSS